MSPQKSSLCPSWNDLYSSGLIFSVPVGVSTTSRVLMLIGAGLHKKVPQPSGFSCSPLFLVGGPVASAQLHLILCICHCLPWPSLNCLRVPTPAKSPGTLSWQPLVALVLTS